jgi:hypothetical protein
MVPCSTAAVAPLAKTIFTGAGVALALGVGLLAGVAVRAGGSGVAVSKDAGGVKVGGGVAVAASWLGRLQPTNMTTSMPSDISMTGLRKRRYGRMVPILQTLLKASG